MHKALNVARLLLVLLGCCAFLLLAGPAQAGEDPIGALGDSGPEQAAEGASGVSGGPASAEADKTEDTAKEALDGSAQATDDAVSKFDRDAASQDRSETVEESNEGAEPAAADGDVDGTPLRPEANVKAAAADDTLDAVEATARVAADARDNAGARQAEAEQSASELINLVQRTSDDGLETATTELARAPADVLQKTSDRVAAPAEKTITRMHDTVTQVVEVAHSATKTDKIMRPVRDAAEGASELVDEAFTSVGTVAVPTVEKAASDLDETAERLVE